MTPTGQLTIDAAFAGGRLTTLAVHLRRPPVDRLFVGQTPAKLLSCIPALFALCAQAQAGAAAAALAAAQGGTPPPAPRQAWVELLHETLWRLLLDWPAALALPPRQDALAAWRHARSGSGLLAASRSLLADTLHPLADLCRRALQNAGESAVVSTHADAAPAPDLAAAAILARWRQAGSAWPSLPPTLKPASVAACYEARLAQVEEAVEALTEGRPFPLAAAGGEGWGVARSLTARGVLTHAVRLEDGRVTAYRVTAPTDACFADAAALSALLAGRRFEDARRARQALARAVLALDPCVPYTVEWRDA